MDSSASPDSPSVLVLAFEPRMRNARSPPYPRDAIASRVTFARSGATVTVVRVPRGIDSSSSPARLDIVSDLAGDSCLAIVRLSLVRFFNKFILELRNCLQFYH